MVATPAADAYAAHPGADDERTLDQRRFDALVTICAAALGRPDAPAGRAGVRPTVYLYADLATWAGLAEHPVELDGYGVIPAGAAREHFTAARWRAVVTDAAGAVTAVPKASYTPSADLNRQLHVADRRCGFPSCGAAVWFCDADHNRPYDSSGCTDADNCRAALPAAPPAQDLHYLVLATGGRRGDRVDRPERGPLGPGADPVPDAGGPGVRRLGVGGPCADGLRAACGPTGGLQWGPAVLIEFCVRRLVIRSGAGRHQRARLRR